MTIERVEKAEWLPFFDFMSKVLLGRRAEVDVVSLKHGDQCVAEWLPLLGIAYDPKNDFVEIALEGMDHRVHRPQELYVDFAAGSTTSIEVIDGDAVRQIVILRSALMLPES